MSYARYRIYADGPGFARVVDMGDSWGASQTGVQWGDKDKPLSAGEVLRRGRDWQRMAAPYWTGTGLREATPAEIAARDAATAQAIADAQAAEAADPATVLNAFVTLAQKLGRAGYTPVPTHPRDLIGGLPAIVSFIQGKLDAKDAQLRAVRDEITALTDANQFKQAFQKQVDYNNLMIQRCQLQDGYNEIQSWALALIIRQGAGK